MSDDLKIQFQYHHEDGEGQFFEDRDPVGFWQAIQQVVAENTANSDEPRLDAIRRLDTMRLRNGNVAKHVMEFKDTLKTFGSLGGDDGDSAILQYFLNSLRETPRLDNWRANQQRTFRESTLE